MVTDTTEVGSTSVTNIPLQIKNNGAHDFFNEFTDLLIL